MLQTRFGIIEQLCYNILNCIEVQNMHINNLDLQSIFPMCTIKKHCNSCKSCKSQKLGIRTKLGPSHLNIGVFPVIVPFCAIKKQRK